LQPGATKADFEQAVKQQRAEELLNWINVFPGEMIYVAGGTVHTLGPGSVIVETQQQSDVTYRLYDYGRPRELHLEDGIKAMREKTNSGKVIRPAPSAIDGTRNRRSPLISSPYFAVEKFELKEHQEFHTNDSPNKSSVQILVALEGCGQVAVEGAPPVTLAKGDAVVVPASAGEFQISPQWELELLKARVPGEPVAEPATRM
jgi:mannose-6-phosphate isomerase